MAEKKVATAAMVDRCVTAKIAHDKAKNELDEAKAVIKPLLNVGESATGTKGTVKKGETAYKVIDILKTFKRLGKTKFLTVIEVQITKLVDLLGKVEVDALTEGYNKVEKLTIKPKK